MFVLDAGRERYGRAVRYRAYEHPPCESHRQQTGGTSRSNGPDYNTTYCRSPARPAATHCQALHATVETPAHVRCSPRRQMSDTHSRVNSLPHPKASTRWSRHASRVPKRLRCSPCACAGVSVTPSAHMNGNSTVAVDRRKMARRTEGTPVVLCSSPLPMDAGTGREAPIRRDADLPSSSIRQTPTRSSACTDARHARAVTNVRAAHVGRDDRTVGRCAIPH